MSSEPPHRTRIKICGVTTPETSRVACRAGADAVGVVLAEGSPRRIAVARGLEILRGLPPFVDGVGVFRLAADGRDEDLERWADAARWCQVHGDAGEREIAALARTHRVIRGFRFEAAAVRRWQACPGVAALLVDGSEGGAGASFDHAALAALAAEITRPVILAGGLRPDTVGAAIRGVRPWAVDVSSGVESAPGEKDPELIRAFCAAVREADAALTPAPSSSPPA